MESELMWYAFALLMMVSVCTLFFALGGVAERKGMRKTEIVLQFGGLLGACAVLMSWIAVCRNDGVFRTPLSLAMTFRDINHLVQMYSPLAMVMIAILIFFLRLIKLSKKAQI